LRLVFRFLPDFVASLAIPARPWQTDAMREVTFCVEACPETGGFVARWDDARGGGITTQGDDLAELHAMIADAVKAYCEPGQHPARIRLHFVQDPVFALA
jgi:predicted RNase H-like HicB family nuclease